ncbi:MAG: hypothetical protein ABT19_15535 [Rhodanobacter sp. SCN 68-63]|nr:MAG: hypothetical protein ABT19_15535 [Rhodanobacter sp. SCN 68-63]
MSGDRHARGQPAAAHRRDQRIQRWHLSKQPGVALHLLGHRLTRGLGRCTAVQHGAGPRDQLQLGLHRTLGHYHVGGDAARGRGQRQRAAVVAR